MFYANYIRLCNSIQKSPSAVAEEIGIKRSTVTRWKQGNSQTDANVQKVADYFGVTSEYLLTDHSNENEKAPTADGERMMHGVPDEETLKLLELLESRPDIRYLAAASERATPEHVKATARMFDELYGRSPDE